MTPRPERPTRFSPACLVAVLAAAVALAAATPSARAETARAAGAVMLVADPKLHNPVWTHAVVLAAPVPEGGHIGVILNRPTSTTLGALFPDHPPSTAVARPVHFGGPVHPAVIVALVQARPDERDLGRTFAMAPGLRLVIEGSAVDRVIEEDGDGARYFAGLVLWPAGELRAEIARGLWSVREADSRTVMRPDTRGLWDELSPALELVVASAPRHAHGRVKGFPDGAAFSGSAGSAGRQGWSKRH